MKIPAGTILCVFDSIKDSVINESLHILAPALDLSSSSGSDVSGLIYGRDISIPPRKSGPGHPVQLHVVRDESLYLPNHETLARILADICRKNPPGIVLFSHNMRNAACAAILAKTLNCPCYADICGIAETDTGLIFKRRVQGGKTIHEYTVKEFPIIMTLTPGAFKSGTFSLSSFASSAEIIPHVKSEPPAYTPLELYAPEEFLALNLADAQIIFSAGSGTGGPESIVSLKKLAAMFPDSALGASRPVCDRGRLSYAHQIGITGKTVSPSAYIAFGISGSQQHIAGMKNSGLIISVNTDPDAALHEICDYVILEDAPSFIQILMEVKSGLKE